ncbi:phosphorylase b kinase regulatory subunit beta-like, partial [Python bivittatus]|uniref:Phosphorylase b kinase regulatory subunit n=1 Tax=Python bivittatus TaxID=176946 RepID=A0A9F2WKW2_PYTBI
TLISGAVVEQLDFLRISDTEEPPEFKSFEELELPKHSKVKRQTSTPNATELEQQPDINSNDWKNKPVYEILQKLNDCSCLASQIILLNILLKREGPHFITKEGTVSDHIERIYRKAGSKKLWSVVRFAASLLCKLVDSLAPSITNVLVQGKQVTLGAFGQEEEIISNPLSPSAIKDIIYNKCNLQDEREAVLQQELVIHIGWIISNSPELFNGMLKIRVGLVHHSLNLFSVMSVNPYIPPAQIEIPGSHVSPGRLGRTSRALPSVTTFQVLNINRTVIESLIYV